MSNLTESQQKCADAHSIVRTVGQLPIGAEFTIKDYCYVPGGKYKDANGVEKESSKPALLTSFENATVNVIDASATVAIIPFTDDDGKRVTCWRCEGDFHDKLREVIRANAGKNNAEILQVIVNEFKDKPLVVTSIVHHQASGKYGTYLRPFVNISFKRS